MFEFNPVGAQVFYYEFIQSIFCRMGLSEFCADPLARVSAE